MMRLDNAFDALKVSGHRSFFGDLPCWQIRCLPCARSFIFILIIGSIPCHRPLPRPFLYSVLYAFLMLLKLIKLISKCIQVLRYHSSLWGRPSTPMMGCPASSLLGRQILILKLLMHILGCVGSMQVSGQGLKGLRIVVSKGGFRNRLLGREGVSWRKRRRRCLARKRRLLIRVHRFIKLFGHN